MQPLNIYCWKLDSKLGGDEDHADRGACFKNWDWAFRSTTTTTN
jgi:hypothetical protein